MKKDSPDLKTDEETLYGMFRSRAMRYKGRECLRFKKEGIYQSLSWAEVHEGILNLAGYLLSLGFQKGDRISLLSENRPEWAIADLAILSIGCMTVPLYPTLTPKEIEQLLKDAGAGCLLVSHPSLVQGLSNWKGPILSFEASSFAKILSEGEAFREKKDDFQLRLQQTRGKDFASIIYTSGTTGQPKGVMLTHENFLSNCRACSGVIAISEKDLYLSFLPLSHVFERMAGFYLVLFQGGSIAYAENIDTVFQNMQEVKPTVMCGVPRFFEKVQEAILESVNRGPFLKRKIFFWAMRIGKAWAKAVQAKKPISWRTRIQYPIAAFLVLRPLRRKLGRSLRFLISGGAPLSAELIEFFDAFQCVILEGYGLTETSPVISVNRLDRRKWGSVGLPIPGVEVKIAEDGEILVRGPNVMRGYYQNEAATREVFQGGYFLTGDIGYLDPEQFLFITDRKKDLIKTSGGKFVSPQKLENLLKNDPFIDEVAVYGDRRKYIVALFVPNFERLEGVRRDLGISVENRGTLLKHPDILRFFRQRLDACQSGLSRFEKIKAFALLERELTQANGELTPTLKVKRKRLYEKYRDLVESLYPDSEQIKIDKDI